MINLKLLFLLPILCSKLAYSSVGKEWKHITTKDDISIYSKKTRGVDIKSLKAIGVIDSKIENIVSILRDVPSATSWLPNLTERSYIENISDREAILFDISDLPWPVKDRELVVHHKLSIAEDLESLILNFQSVERKDKKVGHNRIRAKFHYGQIVFTPMKNKTKLEMTILVDPMGSIPKWVVNLIQVSMPYDFLMALNKFASKTKLKPLPEIQTLLDQLKR